MTPRFSVQFNPNPSYDKSFNMTTSKGTWVIIDNHPNAPHRIVEVRDTDQEAQAEAERLNEMYKNNPDV